MTVYIIDLESITTRYTCEWKTYLPELIRKNGHNVVSIEGPEELPDNTTPGMFLNFSATNIYKSIQVEKFSRLFSEGKIKDGDYFLFADAWHPGIINLKYMSSLLGIKIKIGAFWHAGSYDKNDGLGRLIGDAPWVRNAEKSFFEAIDHNYFATKYHYELFEQELFKTTTDHWIDRQLINKKIVRSGWPMEYMKEVMAPYANLPKRDLILFPHRIAPEKQVDIFRDLAIQLPQYEFVVCQDQKLSKHEYHTLLGQSKMVFSANLQETLGISTCAEGPLVNSMPMMPSRLSYREIFREHADFLYPNQWTYNWQSYQDNKEKLVELIKTQMGQYDSIVPSIEKFVKADYENYFHSEKMLEIINDYV